MKIILAILMKKILSINIQKKKTFNKLEIQENFKILEGIHG